MSGFIKYQHEPIHEYPHVVSTHRNGARYYYGRFQGRDAAFAALVWIGMSLAGSMPRPLSDKHAIPDGE